MAGEQNLVQRMAHSVADKWPTIAATISAATALLAAVGVGAGLTSGILRNYPISVCLFILLFAIGAVSVAFSGRSRLVLLLSGSMLLGSLLLLAIRAAQESRVGQRPHLVATLETLASGLMKVSVTMKSDGFTRDEPIYLLAAGRLRGAVTSSTDAAVPIKEAMLGPTAAGQIEAIFAFEVNPARFKDVLLVASTNKSVVTSMTAASASYPLACIPWQAEAAPVGDVRSSCIRLNLPFEAARPAVFASLSSPDSNGNATLTVNVSASAVPASKLVVVQAWNATDSLTDQVLVPDLTGKIQSTVLTFPVNAGKTDVCVVAALAAPNEAGGLAPMPFQAGTCSSAESLPPNAVFARVRREAVSVTPKRTGGRVQARVRTPLAPQVKNCAQPALAAGTE
jgi:NADH:ubiquinone oxidoreductase subunit K